MLRLLLLRHAEAVPAGGGNDADRRLTTGGRAGAEKMGAYLQSAKLTPDRVIVSPAHRTIETLDEVERRLNAPLQRLVTPALYNAGVSAILASLAETPPTVRTLLVVAHNPGLAETANILSKSGKREDLARLRTGFPSPCLAVIDFDANEWKQVGQGKGRLDRFITLSNLQNAQRQA